jgi:SpoVK/Ycf46/Vps4 family AAA+-type ATPase
MKNNNKNYEYYVEHNETFKAVQSSKKVKKLPPSFYEIMSDPRSGEIYFKKTKNTHDKLIDLPDTAYETIVNELNHFLLPSTKKKFKEFGFLYKRSSLLYGPPGTGKTCTINRVANKVIELGGIVLFNPDPSLISGAIERINSIQPDTTVLVIFEELDRLVQRYEEELLSILDGEIQKENIIYLATTNFINKIPQRIKRPGRFSSVIEVSFPSYIARETFIKSKVKDPKLVDLIVKNSEGLSIDEITECIKSVCCFEQDILKVVTRIKENDRVSMKSHSIQNYHKQKDILKQLEKGLDEYELKINGDDYDDYDDYDDDL